MNFSSGIPRIVIGLFVLACGAASYFKFANKFEQPDVKLLVGSTGIEVTWPLFLTLLAVAGVVGLVILVLGILSLRNEA